MDYKDDNNNNSGIRIRLDKNISIKQEKLLKNCRMCEKMVDEKELNRGIFYYPKEDVWFKRLDVIHSHFYQKNPETILFYCIDCYVTRHINRCFFKCSTCGILGNRDDMEKIYEREMKIGENFLIVMQNEFTLPENSKVLKFKESELVCKKCCSFFLKKGILSLFSQSKKKRCLEKKKKNSGKMVKQIMEKKKCDLCNTKWEWDKVKHSPYWNTFISEKKCNSEHGSFYCTYPCPLKKYPSILCDQCFEFYCPFKISDCITCFQCKNTFVPFMEGEDFAKECSGKIEESGVFRASITHESNQDSNLLCECNDFNWVDPVKPKEFVEGQTLCDECIYECVENGILEPQRIM